MTLFYEVGISDRLLLIVTRDLTKPPRQRQRERQKAIGLISKTTTLHVQKKHAFFVNIFALTAQLRREMTKF